MHLDAEARTREWANCEDGVLMADEEYMLTTTDIAEIAGVSQAAVGNWKKRAADFPSPTGQNKRGPLYLRNDVMLWLSSNNKLKSPAEQSGDLTKFLTLLGGGLNGNGDPRVLLMLLALREVMGNSDWTAMLTEDQGAIASRLVSVAEEEFRWPYAKLTLADLETSALVDLLGLIGELSQSSRSELAESLVSGNFAGGRLLSYDNEMPRGVAELMARLAGPGTSYFDPAAGSGLLLIAAKGVNVAQGSTYSGQVWEPTTLEGAELNLRAHDIDPDLADGIGMIEDQFGHDQFDRIVVSPPWGLRLLDPERLESDPRWLFGEPGVNDWETAWIQHCLYHLAEGGRAVMAMPPKILFGGGKSGRIMQRIVKAGHLQAVIVLPPGLPRETNMTVVLLVLEKRERIGGGRPKAVLMVDATATGDGEHRREDLNPEMIELLSSRFWEWKQGCMVEGPVAAGASFDDLVRNDFNLTPRRYLPSPDVSASQDALLAQRARAEKALKVALERCAEADRKLLSGKAELR